MLLIWLHIVHWMSYWTILCYCCMHTLFLSSCIDIVTSTKSTNKSYRCQKYESVTYPLKFLEEWRVRSRAFQSISNNCLSQRFGGSWFADEEQWYSQLNAYDHHEDVLFESWIGCYAWCQIEFVEESRLDSEIKSIRYALVSMKIKI